MSRKLMFAILAALPLAGAAICATAQDVASTPTPNSRPSFFQHMLKAMDSNGDGKISLDEYKAAATNRFHSIDTQNKGSIDAADIAASPVMVQRNLKMAQHMVRRLDTAGNGYVTRDEFLAAAGARFDAMDTSHSGKLTAQEIAASPKMRRRDEFAAQRELRRMGAGANGSVTLDQYVAAAAARFAKLDANGDGFIEAGEVTGHRWAKAAQSPATN